MEYQAEKKKFNLKWSAITDCFLAYELYFKNSFVDNKVNTDQTFRIEYPRALVVWKGDAPSMLALRFFAVLRLFLSGNDDHHQLQKFTEFGDAVGDNLKNAYTDLKKLILSLNLPDEKDGKKLVGMFEARLFYFILC